jgi:hypothetical protein
MVAFSTFGVLFRRRDAHSDLDSVDENEATPTGQQIVQAVAVV